MSADRNLPQDPPSTTAGLLQALDGALGGQDIHEDIVSTCDHPRLAARLADWLAAPAAAWREDPLARRRLLCAMRLLHDTDPLAPDADERRASCQASLDALGADDPHAVLARCSGAVGPAINGRDTRTLLTSAATLGPALATWAVWLLVTRAYQHPDEAPVLLHRLDGQGGQHITDGLGQGVQRCARYSRTSHEAQANLLAFHAAWRGRGGTADHELPAWLDRCWENRQPATGLAAVPLITVDPGVPASLAQALATCAALFAADGCSMRFRACLTTLPGFVDPAGETLAGSDLGIAERFPRRAIATVVERAVALPELRQPLLAHLAAAQALHRAGGGAALSFGHPVGIHAAIALAQADPGCIPLLVETWRVGWACTEGHALAYVVRHLCGRHGWTTATMPLVALLLVRQDSSAHLTWHLDRGLASALEQPPVAEALLTALRISGVADPEPVEDLAVDHPVLQRILADLAPPRQEHA